MTTPTGFSVSHLVKLLQFIVRAGAGRRKGDQGGISRLGAISPGLLLNRGDGETRPEGVGAGYTWSTQQRAQQQTDADGDVVPLTWLSHAAQLGLEVIIDVVDSPLSSNFSHMLKLALPGNDFTSVILELMGSSNVSIKVAAINLLSLYLCGPDGQIDTKQVTQFEKVGGFHSMSNLLCSFSSSDSVGNRPRHDDFSEDDVSASVIQDLLEALLSLLFWRKRRKYEANLTAAVAGITLPSTTHPFTGESRMSPAKGKYIDDSKRLSMHENSSKLMTVVAGYGVSRRESDYADEVTCRFCFRRLVFVHVICCTLSLTPLVHMRLAQLLPHSSRRVGSIVTRPLTLTMTASCLIDPPYRDPISESAVHPWCLIQASGLTLSRWAPVLA